MVRHQGPDTNPGGPDTDAGRVGAIDRLFLIGATAFWNHRLGTRVQSLATLFLRAPVDEKNLAPADRFRRLLHEAA